MEKLPKQEDDDDYESEPEQPMRRRIVASDDEDENSRRIDSRVSDYGDSDEQGAAAEYEDEIVEQEDKEIVVDDVSVIVDEIVGENMVRNEGEEVEEENKEAEAFVVPTGGAFYMHDDRFRDSSGGGRDRRTLGGKKSWESRDDKKWGHDKFEEMNMQERPYNEGRRMSGGRNRGRGRNQGQDLKYSHGNRPKPQVNSYQNCEPKFVRGKGPRRYQPVTRNNIEAPAYDRSCAMLLPREIRHKYDKHPMSISYNPIENHKSQYFCEICEEELNPERCFYHCYQCAQSIHSCCAPQILQSERAVIHLSCIVPGVYEFVNIKFGGMHNIKDHPHPLIFYQGIESDGNCSECGDNTLIYQMIFKCQRCTYAIDLDCCKDLSS